MPTAQLNVRIDERIKKAGDAVLQREGVSAAQAIRGLWRLMETTQGVPDFVLNEPGIESSEKKRRTLDSIHSGEGLAAKMARDFGIASCDGYDISYKDLRDAMYDEMLDEYLERCSGVESSGESLRA